MNEFWKNDILKFIVKVEGEHSNYNVTIIFNNVLNKIQSAVKQNKNKFDRDTVKKALISAISSSDLKVNCDCKDFQFRIAYYATKNGYKAGVPENRPSNKTNPDDQLGGACKHINAVLNNASWIRNVASVIVNYANYMRDNMEYNYSRFIFPKIFGISYNKGIQMCIDDYDANGELIDKLDTKEEIINLANNIAKDRFKKRAKKQ